MLGILYRIRIFCTNSFTTSYDPMEIITKNKTVESSSSRQSFAYLFDLSSIFYVLKKNSILIGAIIVLFTLIGMLFVYDPKALSEKKKDVGHKLFIIFLISSAVWIFDILLKVFTAFI